VYRCSAKALEYYQAYAAMKDRQRELEGQFHDAMLQWEQDKLTSAQFSQALQSRLIPALQEMRASHNLKFTGELAEMEKHSFTMPEFWKALRSKRGEAHERDRKPLTLQEFGEMYRFVCKVRVDTWRALADELNDKHPVAVRALLDNHELDMLASALDDEVNEDNPLCRWFERRRSGRRQDREVAVEPDGGLLKNRGFEAGLEGWTTYVDGPRPHFEFDTEVVREGRQAPARDCLPTRRCGLLSGSHAQAGAVVQLQWVGADTRTRSPRFAGLQHISYPRESHKRCHRQGHQL
jgi:hypothetical protein